jgi:prepilin-type N-terminal cleavage/methylation domain-containing protein
LSRCIARAFTLLELLIVIVIIGILAALVFPAFAALRAVRNACSAPQICATSYLATDVLLQHNGSWPQIRMRSEDDATQRDYANA